MATLFEIYNIQKTVESASAQLLRTKSVSYVSTSRDTGSLHTPRAEMTYTLTGPTGHYHINVSKQKARLDHFEGNLDINVVTSRGYSSISHDDYCSKILDAFDSVDHLQVSASMPNHIITDCIFQSMNSTVIDDEKLDITDIRYTVKVIIKPASLDSV